ncbi:hypothetical protein RDABS01_025314 [Bienertia sinuspersici]
MFFWKLLVVKRRAKHMVYVVHLQYFTKGA